MNFLVFESMGKIFVMFLQFPVLSDSSQQFLQFLCQVLTEVFEQAKPLSLSRLLRLMQALGNQPVFLRTLDMYQASRAEST